VTVTPIRYGDGLDEEGALDAVTFAGMVTGNRKTALLKRAEMFVLPSYSENFGIAVVEAMAPDCRWLSPTG